VSAEYLNGGLRSVGCPRFMDSHRSLGRLRFFQQFERVLPLLHRENDWGEKL